MTFPGVQEAQPDWYPLPEEVAVVTAEIAVETVVVAGSEGLAELVVVAAVAEDEELDVNARDVGVAEQKGVEGSVAYEPNEYWPGDEAYVEMNVVEDVDQGDVAQEASG